MRWVMALILFATTLSAQQPPVRTAATPAADTTDSARQTLTIPSGTKIPLTLKSPISTKNAKQGDPVYAETAFPVTADNRMAIPPGTYVQGIIDRTQRPGHVKGRGELLIHFTTLIFPNGYTVMMPAMVDNVPGGNSTVKDKEGTIQGPGDAGHKAGTIGTAAATGAGVGAIAGRGLKGAGIGAAGGGLIGTAIALIGRGNDLRLETGSTVQMIVDRPLVLDANRIGR